MQNLVNLNDLNDRYLSLLTQTEKHEKLSGKYKHVTTANTLQPFFDAGFLISNVQYGKRRKTEQDAMLGAHAVRLRNPEMKIGNDYIELVVLNSYDGTAKYSINLGIYRLVCANGMVAGESVFGRAIKHIGSDFHSEVKQSVDTALGRMDELKRVVAKMKEIQLTDAEKSEIASPIFAERLNNVKNLISVDMGYSMRPLRAEDKSNDLWTTINVIQEKILRGGIRYNYNRETKDYQDNVILMPSVKETKAVYDPKSTVKLNKLIFEKAAALANAA